MKKRGAVAVLGQHFCQGGRAHVGTAFSLEVKARVARTDYGEESLDAFRADRIGIFKKDGVLGQMGEMGHRILGRSERLQVARARRFQMHHHHVASGGHGVQQRRGRLVRALICKRTDPPVALGALRSHSRQDGAG